MFEGSGTCPLVYGEGNTVTYDYDVLNQVTNYTHVNGRKL